MVSPEGGGIYIRFTGGPYYYVVGRDMFDSSRTRLAGLVSAAEHLYRRVSWENTVGQNSVA